jgi:hypothetical protein
VGQKKGGEVNLMSGQNLFSQRIINFFHKDTDDYEDECYVSRMSFLILNKY